MTTAMRLDETTLRVAGLQHKRTQLLLYLVAHTGEIMHQDDIYRALWGEEYLGDRKTVATHVHYIREWLQEHPGNGTIQTYHNTGYRYVEDA